MLRNSLAAMVISVGIAGCATKPVEIISDTPPTPTAVIERHIANNGIQGFFPYEDTERHYVRANMRRDESTHKGTGTYSSLLVGTRSEAKIVRIDRNLQWLLNSEKEEYTECPLKGCAEPAKQAPARPHEAPAKQPEAPHESGCIMRIAHTSFTVKATGRQKSINDFDTGEYQVAWVVNLHDKAGRNTTSTLNMDIWTTPLTQAMRDTLAMEDKYAQAFAGAAAETSKPQILPADAAKLMSSYLANALNPGDRNTFLDAGKQMEKIKGYPISTHLTWNMEGNACAPKEAKHKENKSPSKAPIPTSAEGLIFGLAGMFAEKKTADAIKEAAGEPILSFSVEVKSLKIEPMNDSMFTVPKNYRSVPHS
jgi:hypothetical protein